MSMLTWKEVPCVENLQIIYYINYWIILAIAANEAHFLRLLNMGHFFVV